MMRNHYLTAEIRNTIKTIIVRIIIVWHQIFSVLFSGRTSASANDGKWHHICLAWENTAGSWKWFKDGKVVAYGKGFSTGRVNLSFTKYGSWIRVVLHLWHLFMVWSVNLFYRSRDPWRWNPGARAGARFRRRILWCQSKFHRRNGRRQHLGSRDKWPRNHAHV